MNRSASVGKKEEAINFLRGIETKFANTPAKSNTSGSNGWKHVEDSIWLNFQKGPSSKKEKKSMLDKDIFDNFDSCILDKSLTLEKEKGKKKEPEKVPSLEIVKKLEKRMTTPPFSPDRVI